MNSRIPHPQKAETLNAEQNQVMPEIPLTVSATTPLTNDADQVPVGLDSLLASVLSGEEEQPKNREQKKMGACDVQCISLGKLNFGLKINNGWYLAPDGRDFLDIRNAGSEYKVMDA